ncbi:MAG TPA: preprotein translocase subunit YajC [Gemmatimonadales bacterium]|nr:preprotein translocase subunit YajC [Gemmatimonadales bacterium]
MTNPTTVLPALAFLAPADGGGAGGGFSILLVQMLAIGAVFYFLIIRPQGAARRKHQEMLAALKKGDEVMTSGGIVGRVKDIRDVELAGGKETRVTIESGTATVVVERSRIVRVGAATAPGAGAA